MEFCFSSGYRLNFALRAQNRWCQKPDGSWLKLSNKTLVNMTKANDFSMRWKKANFMQGLQAASPLSILTFGGKRATWNNCGILLDGLAQVSCKADLQESLLKLRETFVNLLSVFLEGRSNSEVAAAQFRRLLC